MAGSGGKWVWGCGLGCAGLLLLGALAVVGLVTATRSSFKEFRTAAVWSDSLRAVCGDPRGWIPPPDGIPAPETLERFLAVRDSVLPAERVLTARLREMHELANGGRSLPRVWRVLRGGLGSVREMGQLVTARNRALWRARMNTAEFAWWSVLVYHDWLGQPLLPPDLIDRRHIRLEEQVPALRGLVRSRFQALADTAMAAGGDMAWVAELSAEQKRLLRDPDRLPWQDGLPRRLVTALSPWRERLEAAGSPLALFTAMLEFDRKEKGSRFHVRREEPEVSGGAGQAPPDSSGG